jgi:pyridoxamine 5'-phosphate oxidase
LTDLPASGVERLLAEARARLNRVAPEELASVAAAGALVIDIRPTATRLAEGQLPGAIAVERNVLEWRVDPASPDRIPQASDPDRLVVLVCNEGYQSSLAAAALQDLGLGRATDLVGGYRAWQEAVGVPPGEIDRAAKDLAGLREDYRENGFDRSQIDPDPFVQFGRWFDVWAATGAYDANAMVLATVDPAGRPSARYVLLKGLSDDGFVFYTNRTSHKAVDLDANPAAALCFGWLDLNRQVRVEGRVTQVDDAESDAYFASRPRGSQLGAWVSQQSAVIADRSVLESGLAQVTERFDGRDVPRPPRWGGYRVIPDVIEFWQGRTNRLHDRLRYTRDPDEPTGWRIDRLAP